MESSNLYFEVPVQLELPLDPIEVSSYTQSYNTNTNLVSWNEYANVTCSVTLNDNLEDMLQSQIIQPEIPTKTEADMLRREVQQLTETLYNQYKRIALLVSEVTTLTKQLNEK